MGKRKNREDERSAAPREERGRGTEETGVDRPGRPGNSNVSFGSGGKTQKHKEKRFGHN